jgi:alpha-1,3-rhamnosyl/mannosyltransferase
MACGTPVACSSASSLPEVAEDAALYFDPMQPASIAQTLQSLLDDDALRCRLAGKGEQRARQFTWARTASATLAVYRKAVS